MTDVERAFTCESHFDTHSHSQSVTTLAHSRHPHPRHSSSLQNWNNWEEKLINLPKFHNLGPSLDTFDALDNTLDASFNHNHHPRHYATSKSGIGSECMHQSATNLIKEALEQDKMCIDLHTSITTCIYYIYVYKCIYNMHYGLMV